MSSLELWTEIQKHQTQLEQTYVPGRRKSLWHVNWLLLATMDTRRIKLRRLILAFLGIDIPVISKYKYVKRIPSLSVVAFVVSFLVTYFNCLTDCRRSLASLYIELWRFLYIYGYDSLLGLDRNKVSVVWCVHLNFAAREHFFCTWCSSRDYL